MLHFSLCLHSACRLWYVAGCHMCVLSIPPDSVTPQHNRDFALYLLNRTENMAQKSNESCISIEVVNRVLSYFTELEQHRKPHTDIFYNINMFFLIFIG